MEILEKFLIAVGGGATALIAVLTIFKSMFLKVFDKAINTTFDKNIEKYRNKLSRTTIAYELLLKKELDFYERLDPHMATLVPLVQDLAYYVKGDEGFEQSTQCEKYRENLLTYLNMIPKLKNDGVLYQPYIPQNIWTAVASLIGEMQKELEFWKETGESLFGLNEIPVKVLKAEKISSSLLMHIAIVETVVKKRLTELSEA